MTTPVIIDVIMAVVLIAAVIYGAHRGLFRALAGLAVVIVALVGAAIIANTLAAPAARLVTPLIREQIETKVDEAMARQSQEVQMPEEDVDEGFAIEDLLALMGLDEDVRNSLASQTQEKIQDTGVSLVMAVVESLDDAIAHIAAHSTHHSDCIVTEDAAAAARFTRQVDSAAVYVNVSTRFTDGGEFGLGCEMGISTQKLHARGPMGLDELSTYKYVVTGDGQIR